MSDDKKVKIEDVVEGFFGRLKEVLADALGDVAQVIAEKEPAAAKPKLAVVKDNGKSEVATEPPPPDAPSNVRNLRPAS